MPVEDAAAQQAGQMGLRACDPAHLVLEMRFGLADG